MVEWGCRPGPPTSDSQYVVSLLTIYSSQWPIEGLRLLAMAFILLLRLIHRPLFLTGLTRRTVSEGHSHAPSLGGGPFGGSLVSGTSVTHTAMIMYAVSGSAPGLLVVRQQFACSIKQADRRALVVKYVFSVDNPLSTPHPVGDRCQRVMHCQ